MAAPRIFVSSTYYDLRYVRADMQQFEREWGSQLVLFERGNIPYDGGKHLEESCLEEIDKCDIVVSIIGGRYGSESKKDPELSISRLEVEHAIKNGRQLFVFVEQGVYTEFRTYLKNIDHAKEIIWHSVDTVKVFEFIQYIAQLPINNAIFSFDSSQQLMGALREQLSGLFQGILQQQRRGQVDASANKLIEAVKTLDRVVDYLQQAQSAERRELEDILLSRHPAFAELRDALQVPFRLIFENLGELKAIFEYMGFTRVDGREFPAPEREGYLFWANHAKCIGVSRGIFERAEGEADDSLKILPITDSETRARPFVVVR